MNIETMTDAHWPAVRAIYEEGIATGHATFQTSAPTFEEWDAAHLKEPRVVVTDAGEVIAWAALTPVSGRCVYAGVAEVSVYVAAKARGKGAGKLALENLVQASEKTGLWTLQAGVFPENTASLHLHSKAGFRTVGYRERIGKMNGQWRDTVLLERRSELIN
jgi:L-amino acid N-acyltransferase YncA